MSRLAGVPFKIDSQQVPSRDEQGRYGEPPKEAVVRDASGGERTIVLEPESRARAFTRMALEVGRVFKDEKFTQEIINHYRDIDLTAEVGNRLGVDEGTFETSREMISPNGYLPFVERELEHGANRDVLKGRFELATALQLARNISLIRNNLNSRKRKAIGYDRLPVVGDVSDLFPAGVYERIDAVVKSLSEQARDEAMERLGLERTDVYWRQVHDNLDWYTFDTRFGAFARFTASDEEIVYGEGASLRRLGYRMYGGMCGDSFFIGGYDGAVDRVFGFHNFNFHKKLIDWNGGFGDAGFPKMDVSIRVADGDMYVYKRMDKTKAYVSDITFDYDEDDAVDVQIEFDENGDVKGGKLPWEIFDGLNISGLPSPRDGSTWIKFADFPNAQRRQEIRDSVLSRLKTHMAEKLGIDLDAVLAMSRMKPYEALNLFAESAEIPRDHPPEHKDYAKLLVPALAVKS